MINKISGIRFLMCVSFASISVIPTLAIAPEITRGQTSIYVSSWQNMFHWLVKRKKQRPISRGDLCLISPNEKIYSTQPLFLWKGNLKKIEVSEVDGNKYAWKPNIEQKTSVTYTGKEALQPGNSYKWEGFLGDNPAIFANFQIMDEQERLVISNELKALEKQLQAKKADEKTVALEKAQFFAEKELWSDVLQQVYSVPKASSELLQIRKDLPEKLCNQ
ncbi:hypothetical protein WA1_17225 [Scytonema hofmannii PCC 7110]|uniref:DUF928 domain-containing protein n=1 Tax=Scytonema hofmannii PCC 7110 TaxID=128403 RepID=A0A139XAQ0_9CYAN|nr:hypothetical protein [Scytonema hofmannii]KYC41771.1 hypothetical protein WA1_17225 [Scytonema hofmannii PCC 7110]